MTEQTWWIVMGCWALVVIGTIAWIWLQVEKADRELAEQWDVDYDALLEAVGAELADQQDAMKQEAVIPIPTAQFQERMRKAEALGFLDNDPPRVA